jgi:hypothetical protein
MGSLQEELKKQMERLALIHPTAESEAPLPPKSTLAEQRKLAGIVETEAPKDAAPQEKSEDVS